MRAGFASASVAGVLVLAVIAGHQRHAGRCISALAAAFEPMARIAAAGGPTKTSPASAHASANSAFSDRKP